MALHTPYPYGLQGILARKGLMLVMALFVMSGCTERLAQEEDPADTGKYGRLAQEVYMETNRLRAAPAAYARVLQGIDARIKDNIYYPLNTDIGVRMKEGRAVVKEAIVAISKVRPLSHLAWSDALAEVARAHMLDTGPKGLVSHSGSSGQTLKERLLPVMQREGFSAVAENIAYGYDLGQDVVAHLFIDDGVPGRGHRTNLLKRDLNYTGVACGYHQRYRHMCVAIYAYRAE